MSAISHTYHGWQAIQIELRKLNSAGCLQAGPSGEETEGKDGKDVRDLARQAEDLLREFLVSAREECENWP